MSANGVPAALLLLICTTIAAPAVDRWGWPWGLQDSNSTQTDLLAYTGLENLIEYTAFNGFPSSSSCTLENLAVRSEWSTFSDEQKQEYIDAVQCMSKKPPKSSPSFLPGARNRYDDFVGVHINQTLTIHGTGNFLTWHRYFTWAYEQALRNECGYTGYQPYWNWAKYAQDPLSSSLFDGSNLSIGGNGEFREEGDVDIPSPQTPTIKLPHQQGGGCVTSGPLNWTVNLGPVSPAYPDIPPNPLKSGLGHNPRCLRRDISAYVTQHFLTDTNVSSLITDSSTIAAFQTSMQGDRFRSPSYLGVHTGGHFVVGADPGGDLFSSPGDPYFFLHHAMIDRVFWTWQNGDVRVRTFGDEALAGTVTLDDEPPSREARRADVIDLGVNAEPVTIGEVLSTVGGPFCYIYA